MKRRRPMYQSEHEAYNATHYPGTRQLCVECDEPTGRCEDDSLYTDDEHGPLCPDCFHRLLNLHGIDPHQGAEGGKDDRPTDTVFGGDGEMKDADRKFLTEWGGECLHENLFYQYGFYSCEKCELTCYDRDAFKKPRRTFDNWTDFGWLWEKMLEKGKARAFLNSIHGVGTIEEVRWAWWMWEIRLPSDRCQLICDFLREGHNDTARD